MSPKKNLKNPESESDVTCPVCGNAVTLDDPYCPHCGAEFEEEEVEEIEIEEGVPEAPEEPVEEPLEAEYVEEYVEEGPYEAVPPEAPAVHSTGLFDMRVFGIALAVLGILGAAVALQIQWYWTWVPPITENLGLYLLIGIAIIIVGFLGLQWLKKVVTEEGKQVTPMLPTILLSMFVFGILALILFLAGGAINDAIASSQAGMSIVFIVILVVGILFYVMGQKKAITA